MRVESGLEHRPVAAEHVLEARRMMRDGKSMQDAAVKLGVRSMDLDRSLWTHIATDDADLEPVYVWPWEPDFD